MIEDMKDGAQMLAATFGTIGVALLLIDSGAHAQPRPQASPITAPTPSGKRGLTPPEGRAKPIVTRATFSIAPTSGTWSTKVAVTGIELDKVTAAKVVWYPSDDDVQFGNQMRGPFTAWFKASSPTSAEVMIPQGLETSVVRVLLTRPDGDVLAGRFTVDRNVRIDKVWVKHAGVLREQSWAQAGDRVDAVGVNLDRITRIGLGDGIEVTPGVSFDKATFVLPAGCTGTRPWILRTASGDANAPASFTCDVPPKVTSLPATTPWGTQVGISGENLAQITKIRGPGNFEATPVCSELLCRVTLPRLPFSSPLSGSLTLEGGKAPMTTVQQITITPVPFMRGLSAEFGPPGTVVFVSLTNVTSATNVNLDGRGVGNGGPNGTSFTVPQGATSGPVIVSTSTGSTEDSQDFFVGTPPAPIVTSISPASAKVGAKARLVGQNLSGLEITFANGVKASTASSGLVHKLTAYEFVVPPGAASGPLTVKGPSGQITTAPLTVIP
jgi:hypothetical protein